MYSSEICTLILDLQDDKTLPQCFALLITQYHAITNNRSHCMLPSNRENSWRPNNTLYCPHPHQGSAGLGEEADKGENPSAVKVIMKRESVPVAPGIAVSTAPLCNRYRRQGRLGSGETHCNPNTAP